MGWKELEHVHVANTLAKRHERHLDRFEDGSLFQIEKRNGSTHIQFKFNDSATLSTLIDIVNTFKEFARAKRAPTYIHIIIPHDDKLAKISFPLEKTVEDKFPYFELAKMHLKIAPDHPRPHSPSAREIVGQLAALVYAHRAVRAQERKGLVAADVGIQFYKERNGKKDVKRMTDIDLFQLREVADTKGGACYHVFPVEVFMGKADTIRKKLKTIKPMIDVLRILAEREGKNIKVTPIAVHIYRPRKEENFDPPAEKIKRIESIIRKEFGDSHVIALATTSKAQQKRGKKNKNMKMKIEKPRGHIEYMWGILRSIAEFPIKFHTPLVSIAIKEIQDIEYLKQRHREITYLRKKWRDPRIHESAKHYLIDRYIDHALRGAKKPLEAAIKDTLERYREIPPDHLKNSNGK